MTRCAGPTTAESAPRSDRPNIAAAERHVGADGDRLCDRVGMGWSEIAYAKSGEHHIAFREIVGDGGGDQEIVMVTGEFWPMESFASAPPDVERLIRGLAELGRLVLFDRRGIGLSDPISDWDTPLAGQWAEDLAAVISAAGCDRPTVFSWHHAPIARTCSILHPDLISRLVLFNPSSPVTKADADWTREYAASRTRNVEHQETTDNQMPGRRDDPEFQEWLRFAGRAGASPAQAARILHKVFRDPYPDHGAVRVPTLVITRASADGAIPAEFYQRAAHDIPDAELVALPPGDGMAVGAGVDDLLAEISRHLTGEIRLPPPERQLAVILFTDLVGSTRRAVTSGDAAWKRLLDHHDAISRLEVARRGGEVIKTTGDGILALLPSATAAIQAARAIRTGLAEDHLQVRIGIHLGEIDRRGGDVSGLAVNIAARIMATAEPDQILTSAMVRQTTDTTTFTNLGQRTLKDIEGSWELHAVV